MAFLLVSLCNPLEGAAQTWSDADLSAVTGTPGGARPMGYIRTDGVTTVVYQSNDDHIHELSLPPR
jgi:hypothetical protein